ncbi:MAG: acetyltransferase [Planctomycetota bacterium]
MNQPEHQTLEPGQTESFSTWAIVDVMGHQRYAGRVTEQTVAGSGFLRVDVPEVDAVDWQGKPIGKKLQGFSKLFAPGSIHSMTPCSEPVARAAAATLAVVPIREFDLLPAQATDHDAPDDEGGY